MEDAGRAATVRTYRSTHSRQILRLLRAVAALTKLAMPTSAILETVMKPKPLTIDSAFALAALQDETRRGGPRRFTALAVRAPGATEAVNAEWQRRIERDYFACGCDIGTAASLVAVASCIVAFAARTGGWAALAWTDGLLLLATCVAAAGMGKLVGIRLARHRLRKTLAELASLYPPLPAEPAGQRRTRQCSVQG